MGFLPLSPVAIPWQTLSTANPVINGKTCAIHSPQRPHSLMTTPKGNAFRIEIRAGDYVPSIDGVGGNGKQRCEILYPTRYGWDATAEDLWVSYWLMIASVSDLSAPGWTITSQWHADDAVGGSPPWEFNASGNFLNPGDHVGLTARYNSDPLTPATVHSAPLYNGNAPLPRFAWHSVVGHCRFDSSVGGTGRERHWLNSTQLTDYRGPVGYAAATSGPYKKFGLYRKDRAETDVIFIANMEFGNVDLSSRIATPLALDFS